MSLVVGIRNSIDKGLPIAFCAGARVFVCDTPRTRVKDPAFMPAAKAGAQPAPGAPYADQLASELRATRERIEVLCVQKGKAIKQIAPNGLGKLSLEEATDIQNALERMPDAKRIGE